MTTQGIQIRQAIISAISSGMKDKDAIYTHVMTQLNVPRPTVRRVTREYILDLEYRLSILKPAPGETTFQ